MSNNKTGDYYMKLNIRLVYKYVIYVLPLVLGEMFGIFEGGDASAILKYRPNVRLIGRHRIFTQRPPAPCSTNIVVRSTRVPNPLAQHSMKFRQ